MFVELEYLIFFVGYFMEVNAKPTCCEPPATMGRFVWICQKRDRALQCEIPCLFGWLFVFLTYEVKGLHNLYNIKDYQGVISRFHVWMHAGVSWDAAYQPSES